MACDKDVPAIRQPCRPQGFDALQVHVRRLSDSGRQQDQLRRIVAQRQNPLPVG